MTRPTRRFYGDDDEYEERERRRKRARARERARGWHRFLFVAGLLLVLAVVVPLFSLLQAIVRSLAPLVPLFGRVLAAVVGVLVLAGLVAIVLRLYGLLQEQLQKRDDRDVVRIGKEERVAVRDRDSRRIALLYDGSTSTPLFASQRVVNEPQAPPLALPPYGPYVGVSAPREQEAYGSHEGERERAIYHYRDVCGTLEPGQVLMGVRPKDGTLRMGTWDDIKTVLVLGAMASGKTNTMTSKVCEAASGGAHLVVCDPHGHKPDSLYQRVGPLVGVLFPGTTLAVTHEQILENVLVVRTELERRIRGESYHRPVVLVLDEWNRLQRDEEIAAQLAYIAEILGQEGRGFHMYGMLGAQRISHFANLRKSVVAVIVHRCDESEAKLVLPSRYARLAPELPSGMSFVKDADGMIELLQQVLISHRDVEQVADRLLAGPRPRAAMPAPPPQTVPQYPPPYAPPTGAPLVRLLNAPHVPFPPNVPKQGERAIEQRLGSFGTRGTRQAQTPQHNSLNGLNVPIELQQKIIRLRRSGMARRKIKDKLGLHGARYEIIKRVLNEAGLE